MTKKEFLNILRIYGACGPAIRYVIEHKSKDVCKIIDDCPDIEWLIWLMGREHRLHRFVRICAKRIDNIYYSESYVKCYWREIERKDFDQAAYWVSTMADKAARDVKYLPDSFFQIEYAKERGKQFNGLKRIAKDWANGKPAEK